MNVAEYGAKTIGGSNGVSALVLSDRFGDAQLSLGLASGYFFFGYFKCISGFLNHCFVLGPLNLRHGESRHIRRDVNGLSCLNFDSVSSNSQAKLDRWRDCREK